MRLLYNLMIAGFATLLAYPSVAQSLPNSQIYCFDLDKFGDSIQFKNCRYLTSFNPKGYNNQPQWVNNNELYISVITPYDTLQTDIFSLSLVNNTLTRVTATNESEYSPTMMPDRKNFSCVRVDAGQIPVQRLWMYPVDRSTGGRDVIPLHQDIGYHCWLNDTRVALFIVNGSSNYLKLVNTADQSAVQLSNDIGRCLYRLPDGRLAYVQKSASQPWIIRAIDPISYRTEDLTTTLPRSEDYVVLPDGNILMGSGSKLYRFKMGSPMGQWTEIADLSRFGIFNVKRLAVSRESDKIAIVTDVPK